MKISKNDLWGIISIIVSAMLLSLAIALETDNGLISLLMCINFGIFSYHLVTYSIKLHNLCKEEKFQTIMGYINCPDRVTSHPQAKFKKGDWIITNEDFEYNLGYCLHIEEVVTDGSDNYYNIRTYYKEPLIPLYEETLSQYHASWIDKNYRLATPEEIQYHKEHYSQPQS